MQGREPSLPWDFEDDGTDDQCWRVKASLMVSSAAQPDAAGVQQQHAAAPAGSLQEAALGSGKRSRANKELDSISQPLVNVLALCGPGARQVLVFCSSGTQPARVHPQKAVSK